MLGNHGSWAKLSIWCRGELTMPVPGLELAFTWIEARMGHNRYGVAIPDLRWSSASPGVHGQRAKFYR
ncbi:hypothetical protein ACLK19_04905 [Escherichia coli]